MNNHTTTSKGCVSGVTLDTRRIATRTQPHTASAGRRRLFTIEIVNGGLPIHIGAALLDHLHLQTLQGYVAVFAEDVVATDLPGVMS